MSNFRTHNIIGGTDGLYVILQDTTSSSAYTSNDINIDTGVVSAELTLTDATTGDVYVATLTDDDVQYARSVSGHVIPASRFLPEIIAIPDALYISSYEIVANRISLPFPKTTLSVKNSVFYGVVDVKIKRSIINTSWKIVYSGKSLYYDNSLKLKSWYDNIKIANELGFTSEALRLLNALRKVVV